jgi:hypothetical protein
MLMLFQTPGIDTFHPEESGETYITQSAQIPVNESEVVAGALPKNVKALIPHPEKAWFPI